MCDNSKPIQLLTTNCLEIRNKAAKERIIKEINNFIETGMENVTIQRDIYYYNHQIIDDIISESIGTIGYYKKGRDDVIVFYLKEQ